MERKNWFQKNLRRKECNRYVVSSTKNHCCCGRSAREHLPQALKEDEHNKEEWDAVADTKEYATNAYGVISAQGKINRRSYLQTEAKYVRITESMKFQVLWELLTEVWNLNRPKLGLILRARLHDNPKSDRDEDHSQEWIQAMVHASQDEKIRAWIFTNGRSKAEWSQSVSQQESKIPPAIIAIMPWSRVPRKHLLVNDEGQWPAKWYTSNKADMSGLDLNHSHFIFVDDGTNHPDTDCAEKFGRKLFRYLRMKVFVPGQGKVQVPFVNIFLNGTQDDFVNMQKDMQDGSNGTCVVARKQDNKDEYSDDETEDTIKGGADVANKLCVMVEKRQRAHKDSVSSTENKSEADETVYANHVQEENRARMTPNKEYVEAFTGPRVKKNPFQSKLFAINDLKTMEEFVDEHYEEITVVDHGQYCDWITDKILKAALHPKSGVLENFRITVNWNKVSLAKSLLMQDSAQGNNSETALEGQLEKVVQKILLLERNDFFKLLMKVYDINIDKTTLLQLYRASSKDNLIGKQLHYTKNKMRTITYVEAFKDKLYGSERFVSDSNLSLKAIGQTVRRMIGYFYEPLYLRLPEDTEEFTDPARELFLWALLTERHHLARYLWSCQCYPLAAALTAICLLRVQLRHRRDESERDTYKEHIQWFEKHAEEFLDIDDWEPDRDTSMQSNKKSSKRKKKAKISSKDSSTSRIEYLLTRRQEQFGNTTCLQLAVAGECKAFIAHKRTQRLLDKIWYGKISLENPNWRIFLSMILPVYPLVFFREDTKELETGIPTPDVSFSSNKEDNSDICRLPRHLTYPERVWYYVKAPVIVFGYNTLSYVTFLMIFSHILLTQYVIGEAISALQYVLFIYVATQFSEEVRQIINEHWSYFKGLNNSIDLSAMGLFMLGFLFHYIDLMIEASRYIMCLSFFLFCLRLLHIFSVFRQLGPMLIMIRKMMIDLVFFLFFILVFVWAYGVIWMAILYPQGEFSIMMVYGLFRAAYWPVYGEVGHFLDGDLETANCEYINGTLNGCSNAQLVASPILALYVLFINILMLNLLIALFAYRFQEIYDENDKIWGFQRYFLVQQYLERPPFPQPPIAICHIAELLHALIKLILKHVDKNKYQSIVDFIWPWNKPVRVSFHDCKDRLIEEYYLTSFECSYAQNHRSILTEDDLEDDYDDDDDDDIGFNTDLSLIREDKDSDISRTTDPVPAVNC